jgi:hypothetical protein
MLMVQSGAAVADQQAFLLVWTVAYLTGQLTVEFIMCLQVLEGDGCGGLDLVTTGLVGLQRPLFLNSGLPADQVLLL